MMLWLIAAMLALMVVHLTFPTTVLVAATGCYQGLVLLCAHPRHLLKEGDNNPAVLITHAFAPSGHAGGLDTVFNGQIGFLRLLHVLAQ